MRHQAHTPNRATSILLVLLTLTCCLPILTTAQSSFDPTAPSTTTIKNSYLTTSLCPKPIRNGRDRGCRCIRIRSYSDLRGAVRRLDSGECKCFRPFNVYKSPTDPPIELDDLRKATLKCEIYGQCIIQGEGTHMVVTGEESEVTVAGFRFAGATTSSIVVMEDAGTDRRQVREQIFCDNDFIGNHNHYQSGGAILLQPNTHAYVANSYFAQNTANQMGGAISSSNSIVQIVKSTFVANTAALGGAVSSNMPNALLLLADSVFEYNRAGLGHTYGPAVAANGHVQDFGGNDADPRDFMCLHCTLIPGTRPIMVDGERYDDDDKEREYININKADGGDKVGSGFVEEANRNVDLEWELNRYRKNPEFEEEYDLYPDDVLWGPFHIKLYFGRGYQWQEQYKDLNMCIQSKYSEDKVEGKEEPLELYKCDKGEDRQRFVAVGKTIRLEEDRKLCWTYIDVRKIELHKCKGSIYQQWDRLQGDGHFRISPVTDHRRCVTNHHHPRNEERIYLEWCEVAEDGDTLYWTLKNIDHDAPDAATEEPTAAPSDGPTTPRPSRAPVTEEPTASPTPRPSRAPVTDEPTAFPTLSPTMVPTISKMPTVPPTHRPSANPTHVPSPSPTNDPTFEPTNSPTHVPSPSPTNDPTFEPTNSPTEEPSPNPTNSPTISHSPTRTPTSSPTATPSVSPTANPTSSPTFNPTPQPSVSPTARPTAKPVFDPNPDPQCGRQAGGAVCLLPQFCCSADGYCGLGQNYCGPGCQSGSFCANPVTDVEDDKVEDADEFKYVSALKCDDEAEVSYYKNGIERTKSCDHPNFNGANLCHRKLSKLKGTVSDICCAQCKQYAADDPFASLGGQMEGSINVHHP